MRCRHQETLEFQKTPPRFISPSDKYTFEQVLALPIHLPAAPFEFASSSPTPLDPNSVYVNGIHYPHLAEMYMLERADNQQPKHVEIGRHIVDAVESEIRHQHGLRMLKNEEAFDRLREAAATNPSDRTLAHDDAEGVMQIRAGVSGALPIIKMLEKYPEMTAIEASKSTRPYCVEQFTHARGHVIQLLGASAARSGMEITRRDNSPYRQFVDEDGVIVAKTKIATLENEIDLELISRDSFVGIDRGFYGDEVETIDATMGAHEIGLIPIDSTMYFRVRD